MNYLADLFSLAGRVAVVTGGSSGIGAGMAAALAAAGAQVVLIARDEARLKAATEELRQAGGQAHGVSADLADRAEVERAGAAAAEAFGPPDILVNCAGINLRPPLGSLTVADWDLTMAVNLTAPFLCAQHAFRIMKDQTPRGGRIINNGSISAHAPRPYSSAYTSTKHAITGLTKATNLDGRGYDIAVGQIDIGNAATPMTDRMVDGVLQPDGRKMPEPRMDSKAVGDAVAYMASLPLDANVLFMTVMASKMPFVGRG